MINWLREYEDLYMRNAWFRAAADSIIPLILKGLAARAEEIEEKQEGRLEELSTMRRFAGRFGQTTEPCPCDDCGKTKRVTLDPPYLCYSCEAKRAIQELMEKRATS